MISTILVAVDDSPGGLAAARLAVDLAARLSASLQAIAVTADGTVAELLSAGGEGLRPAAADTVLQYVSSIAAQAGIPAQLHQAEGEIAAEILSHASSCDADLIIIGRCRDPGKTAQPYVGSQTSLVLEFAASAVLVVPPV